MAYPNPSDVRWGVAFGATDELTGTLALPVVGDVRSGIGFGEKTIHNDTLYITVTGLGPTGSVGNYVWNGETSRYVHSSGDYIYYDAPGGGYWTWKTAADGMIGINGNGFETPNSLYYDPGQMGVVSGAANWLTTYETAGTLSLPNESDVRSGTDYAGNKTGTCIIPLAADVRNGTSVDASTGDLYLPTTSDVRTGVGFGTKTISATVLTVTGYASGNGAYTFSTDRYVNDYGSYIRWTGSRWDWRFQNNTLIGVNPNGAGDPTGSFYPVTDIGGMVIGTAAWQVTYESTGSLVVPANYDVRAAIVYDGETTGTIVMPYNSDVRFGVTYDNGTDGILAVPAASDVRLNVPFDAVEMSRVVLRNGPAGSDGVYYAGEGSWTQSGGSFYIILAAGVWELHDGEENVVDSTLSEGITGVWDNGTIVAWDAETYGTCAVPSTSNVRFGVAVDDTTGILELPSASDVRSGITYGASAEFVGTLVCSGLALTLTPPVRNMDTEGGLDTSVVNGASLQRSGYVEIWDNNKRKVEEVDDGKPVDSTMQSGVSVLPVVSV